MIDDPISQDAAKVGARVRLLKDHKPYYLGARTTIRAGTKGTIASVDISTLGLCYSAEVKFDTSRKRRWIDIGNLAGLSLLDRIAEI